MTQTVYVLLPVHNRCAVTKQFIGCLSAQTYTDYHLILIDDGSKDDTAAMVQSRIQKVTVLKGRGDWWWAGSLQKGIDWLELHGASGRDIVLFANDDITFDAGFFGKAVAILDEMAGVLLLPYLRDEITGVPQETGVEANFRKLTFVPATTLDRINCLSTRGLFMRIADLRRIGGFRPRLLPHYWSDYEFTIRAHNKGLRLLTNAELVISLDRDQSGYRDFEGLGFFEFLRRYFSKRSVLNPLYHSSFVLLAAPRDTIPANIIKIWRDAFVYMAQHLKRALRKGREVSRKAKAIRLMQSNVKVVIGSAATQYEGWVSTDYPILDIVNRDTFVALFQSSTVSNFVAEHVWEHLSPAEAEKACRNCFAFLKPGGLLRIAVPDGLHPDVDYIEHVKPGGYGPGADDHKVLYSYRTLTTLLEEAGYQVTLLEWFDEYGRFHRNDWDIGDGFIMRSTRFDPRNKNKATAYTSLIVDARKP